MGKQNKLIYQLSRVDKLNIEKKFNRLDACTRLHCEKVSNYAFFIYEKCLKYRVFKKKVSSDVMFYIAEAIKYHDIGKINISYDLLNKPGKFTDSEYELMKQHVLFGREKINDIVENATNDFELQFTQTMLDGILFHHERMDGCGYPFGYTNTQIPLISRIVSVADAFDAMKRVRPYKEAMTDAEAFENLKSCGGSQFDEDIVRVFRRHW